MADALKAWLRTRLGAIMDLTPEMFGRYTRDGTLLAQILHSYDIINRNQLSTILRTDDPALSRVNLRTLRIWLKLINVTLSDECIEEISKGKGAAALQLFYKVYLSLEGKDRLHFIALQKERKYMPIISRFDVCKVPEDPPPYRSPEHPLSQSLIDAADTILWYKNKLGTIAEAYKREQQRFEALTKYPVVQPIEYFIPEERPDEKEEESERLDEFTRKHPALKTKKRSAVECCPGKRLLDTSRVEDPTAAVEYIDYLKKRSGRAIESHKLKLKTQTMMMTEAWERLLRKQDRSFDEALGRRVLDQSRYEKQMMRKLCEVRDLRDRIVENRRIVDAMLLNARENELQQKEDRHREITKEEMADVKMEARRMSELRRRIREEKVRRMKEKHQMICLEIVEDLADIAVKIADYRQTNDSHIPYSTWNEWKTSFLKSQPIFELVEHFDDIEGAEDAGEVKNKEKMIDEEMSERENNVAIKNLKKVGNKEEMKLEDGLKAEERQRLIQLEMERRRSLAEADFVSYLDLNLPWGHFVPKKKEGIEEIPRLGRIVLGYVVHRLLEIFYPYPAEKVGCPVARVKITAIVSGVINPILHEQLRELLENNGIRLVRMEDAINHCLERYKQEMADIEYIDLDIVLATTRDAKGLEGAKSKMKDSTVNRHARRIERTTKVTTAQESVVDDKHTQTPKRIPYDDMDPILSDTAYIGKWTYKFLTLGQPISNELNTKILIEYLKGIGDVQGWVLINYPNTYEQMAMLEKALTGWEVPPDPKIVDFTDTNIEDIDSPLPRIVFEDEVDAFAICRQSRLLPSPISKVKKYRDSSTTFVTMYIKAMLKPKTMDNQEQDYVPLPDDATSMDEHYADQNIAYGFFYSAFDLPTLKRLVKFITSEFPERKIPSEFNEILQTHDGKKGLLIDSKTATIKRLLSKSKWKRSEYEKKKDMETEDRDLQSEVQTQPANSRIRPGEDGWKWLDLFQPPTLMEILATLWESIEGAYVENLKEILPLKRMHTSAVVPYKDLVMKNLTKFVDRPDQRQILLQDFHRAFNEIDEDLREDVDTKCELHCRVDEFRTELWELCDARRHEAEEERRRALRNQWIPLEAAVLVNIYIGILQTEIDRFIDTMQLLQDYYTSMSQKPLRESRFAKITLDESEDVSQITTPTTDTGQTASETKTGSTKASDRAVNLNRFQTEIENLLLDVSKSFDPDQSSVYNTVKDNIQKVRDIVDSTSSMMSEMLKKEERAVDSEKTEIKSKVVGNASHDSTFAKLAKRYRDLVEEWRYAVLFEIDRIHQRLDVLNAAARSDVIFLLDTMRQTFHSIYNYIVDRYKREIDRVNDMANVFCFAIEEKRPIQEELILNGDQLVVRSNVLMFPGDPKRFFVPIREAPSPLRFRMVQLGRLIDILRRIAPRGTMSERALVYVLQEVVSCGEEDCYPPSVPCAWRQLRPPDIEGLIERLFGYATEYIEWREFVLYAMDLPVPSYQDILKAQTVFRTHDPELREVITREQYHSTPLWFLEISTSHENASHKEVDDGDRDQVKSIMLRKEAQFGERISSMKNDFIETREDNSEYIEKKLIESNSAK